MAQLSIVIPTLEEARALPATLANVSSLDPPACDVIVADGGSQDQTLQIAADAGAKTVRSATRGRPAQMNDGAAEASGDLICFLHADTLLPPDAVTLISETLADGRTACGGFVSVMRGPERTRWLTSAHNFIKTYYAPLLFRPISFVNGARLLFGDQAMFCRADDFRAVGGFNIEQTIMEEADFMLRLVRGGHGRARQIHRLVHSSDRRVAKWGGLAANLRYLEIGVKWGLGADPKRLARRYEDVR